MDLSKSLALAMGASFFVMTAHAGGLSDGGGFAYRNTSTRLLSQAISETEARLSNIDGRCLNSALAKKALLAVDLEQMKSVIFQTRKSFDVTRPRRNPEGEIETLNFDFGKDSQGGYIEALKPFFVGNINFNPDAPDANALTLTKNALVHEASHLYGYDEKSASAFEQIIWHTPVLWSEGCDKTREDAIPGTGMKGKELESIVCSYHADANDDPTLDLRFEVKSSSVVEMVVSGRVRESVDDLWSELYRKPVVFTGNRDAFTAEGVGAKLEITRPLARWNSLTKPNAKLSLENVSIYSDLICESLDN